MHLIDDLLLGNEVPQAQEVDIPSLGADEQALAPRLQAEGGDSLEPALQAGLVIKKTHPKNPKKPTKNIFFGGGRGFGFFKIFNML